MLYIILHCNPIYQYCNLFGNIFVFSCNGSFNQSMQHAVILWLWIKPCSWTPHNCPVRPVEYMHFEKRLTIAVKLTLPEGGSLDEGEAVKIVEKYVMCSNVTGVHFS